MATLIIQENKEACPVIFEDVKVPWDKRIMDVINSLVKYKEKGYPLITLIRNKTDYE